MSFTGIRLLHRLWAFSLRGNELHRCSPSSQAQGLFQKEAIFTGVRLLHRLRAFSKKRRSSQAFAFFTGSGPFPKRDDLHRRSPSSQAQGLLGVEPPEVLDVPRILDRLPLLSFQAHGARPGNMNNLERALPHGRELVQPFPGEDPPEYEVSYLKGPGADVAAVISSSACWYLAARSAASRRRSSPSTRSIPRMASCCASSNARTRAERCLTS